MDRVKAWLYGGLRTGVQALWGWLLTLPTVGALLGLLNETQRDALQTTLAAAASGVVIGAVAAAIRWLETRVGETLPARAARWVAKVLMLGLGKFQPVYAQADGATKAQSVIVAAPGTPAQITAESVRPALRE